MHESLYFLAFFSVLTSVICVDQKQTTENLTLPSGQKCSLLNTYCLCFADDLSYEDRCTKIQDTVRMIVPSAYISAQTDSEIHITVPLQPDERHLFVPLFKLLENKKSGLGIKSYGISDSGLEQVFVKVTRDCEMEKQTAAVNVGTVEVGNDEDNDISMPTNSVESNYVQLSSVGKFLFNSCCSMALQFLCRFPTA